MTYFCFPGGWGCYNLNGLAEKELVATLAHGYPTLKQAQAHVNASPTGAQQVLLQSFKFQSVSPVGAGVTGVNQTPNSTGGVSGALGNLAKSFSISGGPTSQNFWIRASEFLLGIGLIIVGLAHIASKTPVGKTAAKVAKAAALT